MNTSSKVYKTENWSSLNFNMTDTSMNSPMPIRVAKKFKEAQNYLKNNGFIRSTKHLLEDIENTFDK